RVRVARYQTQLSRVEFSSAAERPAPAGACSESASPYRAGGRNGRSRGPLVQMWRVGAFVAVVSGNLHTVDTGDVTPAALEYLAGRYTPEVEHGYCITRWHKSTDGTGQVIPVVDEVILSDNERENSELGVQF